VIQHPDFVIFFHFIHSDGDALLLNGRWFAYVDPTHGFDRGTVQSMDIMLSGKIPISLSRFYRIG